MITIFSAQIIIFHKEFSKDNAKFSLFALKLLSKFFGGYEVPLNAEKVVLVEKFFESQVFGIGHGCQVLQSAYYLSHTAHAIAPRIKEVDALPPYGKDI